MDEKEFRDKINNAVRAAIEATKEVVLTQSDIDGLLEEQHRQTAEQILTRLWAVLVRDGEQFIAGEIRKIAEENGIKLD